MCGIAGSIVWKHGKDAQGFDLDALKNRGPDAQVEIDSHAEQLAVADGFRFRLGHARLSIVDLSEQANQPMRTPDGRYWLVFNGEIYNHAELRKELEQVGIRFRTTHSDTEVLLWGFVHWGRAVLDRLNGMFAFVVVDALEGQIFGARDRMGIKPFFYRFAPGVFEFASEIRALKGPKVINRQAIRQYFHFLQAPGDMTFFEGIHKLEASDCFTWRGDGELKIESWWSPLAGDIDRKADPEELEALLRDSVRLRLQADVPVGAYLSGGLDSSLIAAMASEHQQIHTFSFGFDTQATTYKSELPFARQVAQHIGSIHHEVEADRELFLETVRRTFSILDEPIADTACAPLLLLSEQARDHGVKVMLGGEGADELFLGYRGWWDAHRVYQFWNRLPKPLRPLAAMSFCALYGNRKPDWNTWFRRLRAGQMPMWGGIDALVRHREADFLHQDLLASTVDPYTFVHERMVAQVPANADYFQRMSHFDLRFRLPEQLLARIDRMSMAASVEARVPFLDHRVVEHALRMDALKMGTLQEQKRWLKHIAEKYIPQHIVHRPKDGFSIPLEDVMGEWGSSDALALGHASVLSRSGVRGVRGMSGRELWSLFALKLWLEEVN